MNLIKRIRQFFAEIWQAANDPYTCLTEEGKQMWREIEQWEQEHRENAQK